MADQPPPDRQQLALRRALPILIITICVGVVLALLAWRAIRSTGQQPEDAADLGRLAAACEDAAVPGAPAYAGGPGAHPAVAFRRVGDGWVQDQELIPAGLAATSVSAAELVLCVEEMQTLSLPLCAGGEAVSGLRATGRLVAAQTGAQVDQRTFGPQEPDPDCWPAGRPEFSTEPALTTAIRAWVEAYLQ